MWTRREALAAAIGVSAASAAPSGVRLVRIPEGRLQPQLALGADGAVHLLTYGGHAFKGDLFYARAAKVGADFSAAVRVNSQPGSAVAAGTIRGGQLALGSGGAVHVVWNGSQVALPAGPVNPDSGKAGSPLLYSRFASGAFTPQQNLMHHSFGLDGGGALAASRDGHVWVCWHGVAIAEAKGTGKEGEARRRMFVSRSSDGGAHFSDEARAWPAAETGACACCGMRLFAASNGKLYGLYRSATQRVHRDLYLVVSSDGGKQFTGRLLDKWEIDACPMSSMDIAEHGGRVVAAWETAGQVYWGDVSTASGKINAAPDAGKNRKHPRLAFNRNGEMLLVWTEETGWQKGGKLAWQRYGRDGAPVGGMERAEGVPAWSFGAPAALADGGFVVFY